MWRSALVAGSAAMLMATSLAQPAAAGGCDYRPDAVVFLHAPVPWHQQPPIAGTGPGHYYSHHPHHVPGYPHRVTGYPVPIHAAPRPLPRAVIHIHRDWAAHVAWCAGRYRSYDVRTDTFQPYPGFEVDPYREYSEPSFGKKKVLRGGCWATRARLIRNTWRNFYMPSRNNIFAGFRTCAP
jgi:EgtB-related family protein